MHTKYSTKQAQITTDSKLTGVGERDTLIIDKTNTPRFFAMIPYLVDDLDISPYAVRLYLRILRRAGDGGVCWENTRNMAAGCKMSIGQVSKAKKELAEADLITVAVKEKQHGEFPYHEITINDVWTRNIAKYATCSPSEQDLFTQRDRTCSLGEPKDKPVEGMTVEVKKKPSSGSPIPHLPENLGKFSSGTVVHFQRPLAVQAVKAACGYFPPKALYPAVVKLLRDEPTPEDIEDLRKCFVTWTANGHNPKNFNGWLFDWYPNKKYYVPALNKAIDAYQD